jgi:hypothetical protein
MARVDEYNKDVQEWTADTKRKLKREVIQLTAKYSGKGYAEQKATSKRYAGEASKITFSFPYYMVFVHKGAGRGYGGNITGKFTRKDGSKGTTSALSMGRMGSGKRQPKPWFNPVIEAQFPALADLVASYKGDKVILQIQKILIR